MQLRLEDMSQRGRQAVSAAPGAGQTRLVVEGLRPYWTYQRIEQQVPLGRAGVVVQGAWGHGE